MLPISAKSSAGISSMRKPKNIVRSISVIPSFIGSSLSGGVSAEALVIAQNTKTHFEPMVIALFGIGFTPITAMPFFRNFQLARVKTGCFGFSDIKFFYMNRALLLIKSAMVLVTHAITNPTPTPLK